MLLRSTRLTLRVLTAALMLMGVHAFAQDSDKKDEKPVSTSGITDFHAEEKAWEEKLHTTDCRMMPSRMIMADCNEIHRQTKVIYLKSAAQQNDANEILVAVRNMFDPSLKVYLVASQEAISVSTYPEEIARIEAYIHTLDRPHPAYKITFTIVDTDNGKRVGIEHYAMTATDGQRATMKQGSKVPVSTGSYSTSDKAMQQQFTYLDVGMSFDVTPTQLGDMVQLKTKIEQSGVANSQDIAGVMEPVIRQSVYDGVVRAPLGKPTMIGSLDISGTTRHLDVEVLIETM